MWLTLLARFWWAIPIAILTATTAYYRHDAHSEHEQRVQVQAAYDVFKASVEQLGRAQEAKNKQIAANQEKTNRESAKSADARVTAVLDRYRMLAQQSNTRSGSLPPDAAAPKPTDDSARNAELLALLRQADLQTGQLIELQRWVRESLK